ncbi:MAG: metabolite traffic protein EboE [Bacteroidota bacterium]
MKLGQNSAYHLTYCSNIHPGESWQAVRENLDTYTLPLKQQLSPDAPFGVGLRLSDASARELLTGNHLNELVDWLASHDLYVYTFNGFPYGDFHGQVVKDKVYMPDWRTRERVDYTLRLIEILATLLPAGMDGGISTSPLSYKPWLNGDAKAIEDAFATSTAHLAAITEQLVTTHQKTGKLIHIDIEPEPDCLIENIDETIAFFTNWLFPRGRKLLADKLGIAEDEAENLLRTHIRLCYDTCHFAVEFESAADVVKKMSDAGILIGKVQISAAVKVKLPADASQRNAIADRLTPFVESTYLHQVVEQRHDGSLNHYTDLGNALPYILEETAAEWRIHFHVPIFVDDYNQIQSTQGDIVDALKLQVAAPYTTHLEIETYTWGVLPAGLKQDMTTSIYREYDWVLSVLEESDA